jgi:enamine deaminase RidA (YjgF/YER057c/UK114 family)
MYQILDHETRANGLIQSFNVKGITLAPPGFPIRHVTVADMGNSYLITLSGLIGNSEGKLVGSDIHSQALQTIKNIHIALATTAEHMGVKTGNPLEFITFTRADVSDLSQVGELNRAYTEGGIPLASRATLEVRKLPLDAMVEITAIAVFPNPQSATMLRTGNPVQPKYS